MTITSISRRNFDKSNQL